MSTAYHSKYFAHELTKKCSAHQLEKLNQSIFNATVDLNPHQIDAALFAFRSPLSRGAILADEVGLGKTIEAALVISQLWAERKRRILCITPASLRKQWAGELIEKFFIDSLILESKNYNKYIKEGCTNPFEQESKIIICSYHFARSKEREIRSIPWDLVVIDEAHRLRNVYKKSNKIARAIREAIGNCPILLLTATPLQNSLIELFGLVSFIDSHVFGGVSSFREHFIRRAGQMANTGFEELRDRIRPICQRTLRRQITEYIRYTNRVSITQDFTPTEEEAQLYEFVSTYLQRPGAFALPPGQRALITLVLRKILASSSFAIAPTLGKLIDRLETMQQEFVRNAGFEIGDTFGEDFELANEIEEEWEDNNNDAEENVQTPEEITSEEEMLILLNAIREEIQELKNYKNLAESITQNAKGEALLAALKAGFDRLSSYNGPQKALIFTESRRTQRYLFELLESSGYNGQVVMLNGSNPEESSRQIFQRWKEKHSGQEKVTGLKTVDMRTALVEEFRDNASIMVATESGAEGLNLQFCSLVVNYDLPWNPQRIEQRIGRCHRYGQEYDVVVINFLNRRNAADLRVFELLEQKFRLFDGVFGTSDEILGAMESGVDFEKRIIAIYQSCRTTEEINSAFDQLQLELDEQIQIKMQEARSHLFEHFDEEVHERLRLNKQETDTQVKRFEDLLWRFTQFELKRYAVFIENYIFDLKELPEGLASEDISLGRYRLITRQNGTDDYQYRLGHPLAQELISRAKNRKLSCCQVNFHYETYGKKISVIEQLQGKTGWMRLRIVAIEALEKEEHLVFSTITDDGKEIDRDICEKFFSLDATVNNEADLPAEVDAKFQKLITQSQNEIVSQISDRNSEYFLMEIEKLEKWSEDIKEQLENELKELDKEIKAKKKEARLAEELNEKVFLHREAKEIEKKRNEKRRQLFDAQDEVDQRKENLIEELEKRLKQTIEVSEVFTIRWRVS
jgi:superfamily II DNA or RNA helicase